MVKRIFLFLVAGLATLPSAEPRPGAGEVLYNGIQLPSPWPPQLTTLPPDPATPYYLTRPPAVIPIDVGRQLFVDDFLIEQTSLQRTYSLAQYHPASPVLKPEKSWELQNGAMAMPYSDGVWYDPKDKLFKMWYMAGYAINVALATSTDGLVWDRPSLDVVPGTNLVHTGVRDSGAVWLDLNAQDPSRRHVLFRSIKGGATLPDSYGLATHYSADGIHWSEPFDKSGAAGDRSTVFYNPFRNVWVYSLRHGWSLPRKRRYWETPAVNTQMWTNIGDPPYWCMADSKDLPKPPVNVTPELYNLDCVAYESLILGWFTIWYGQPTDRPKINEIQVGYSRDGWSWVRPDRRAFCAVSETKTDWNWGNVTSTVGGLFVMGDELWLYVSGRKGDGAKIDAGGSTGLAVLRRDGFASMNAGATEGTLTTRTVRFKGKHLFVNVDAPAGELRAEVLSPEGQVVAPFSKANCVPVATDKTLQKVTWGGAADLSSLANLDVRIRFSLRNGKLYSFWVSPDLSGASYGYAGAGGPSFPGTVDTVGDGSGPPAPPPGASPAAAGSEDSEGGRCGCGVRLDPRAGLPAMLLSIWLVAFGSLYAALKRRRP